MALQSLESNPQLSFATKWITVMDEQGEGVVIENWTQPKPMRDWVALEKEWSDAHSSENPGDVIVP